MSTLRDLRSIERQFEEQRAAREFHVCCAHLLRAGNFGDAALQAEAAGAGRNVVQCLKSAVGASTLSSAGEISEFRSLVANFMLSLRNVSAFDTMTASMTKLPLRTRVSALAATGAPTEVNEGAAKPVRRLTFSEIFLEPVKAASIIVLSETLIRAAGDEAVSLIGKELKASVSAATDTLFLAELASSNAAAANGSDDLESVTDDISVLLHNIDIGASSKLFLIVSPANAALLAQRAFTAGVGGMAPNGGVFMGLDVIVSDGLATGVVILADASGIAYGDGGVTLDVAKSASLQMDDASTLSSSTPTATNVVSLFQTNSRALRFERSVAFAAVRANTVSALTGVTWGLSGSPA